MTLRNKQALTQGYFEYYISFIRKKQSSRPFRKNPLRFLSEYGIINLALKRSQVLSNTVAVSPPFSGGNTSCPLAFTEGGD